jgi:hypothetical protein
MIMSEPVYITRLGSNLYLDSEGRLHQGIVPDVPAYDPPGGLLRTAQDVSKLAKTFNDIGDALPAEREGKDNKAFLDFQKKITDLGLPPELAKLLGVVGTIAGVIGTAFVALGAAVALAKMLGLFGDGPSPLEQLVKARFDALEKQFNALAQVISQQQLSAKKQALVSARSAVESFVSQRDSGTMSEAQIQSRLQELTGLLSIISTAEVLSLLDSTTYVSLFDASKHTKVWPWITKNLFVFAEGAAPQRAVFPAVNSPVFDSRLALPLGVQAAQTYLALMQSLFPEFRTTGDLRPQLRNVADNLSALAASIRNTTLARTMHFEGDFDGLITDFYVVDPWPGLTRPVLKPDFTFVVGAIDLCHHDDSFFADVGVGGAVPSPGPTRRGSLDLRWYPPANLELSPLSSGLVHDDGTPVRQYRITNAKQCADAANDRAAQDYADLLLSSGYMTLVHLAAQLRHAASQPERSETVRGSVFLQRHPQPGAEVTVHSTPSLALFPKATGDIEATAWRELQRVNAIATATTQSLPRPAPLIRYRVLLRTLSSAVPPRVWHEPDYEAVQTATYVDDPLHRGFKRLHLQTSLDAVLHEELLFEGSSPADVRRFDSVLSVKAHTFDWWIPTRPSPFVSATFDQAAHGALLGREPTAKPSPAVPAALLRPMPRDSIDADLGGRPLVMLGLGWEEGAQTWKGFHREMAQATVEMRVRAEWRNGQLRVVIDNRPQDRNYVVFLVIEESFGSIEADEQPPKVLHTSFKMAINGSLTYVPQALFDEETRVRGKRDEFVHDFGVFVRPEPGEPVFGSIELAELATESGRDRLAAALRQFEPDLMAQLLHQRAAKPLESSR